MGISWFSALLVLCERNPLVSSGFPSQRVSNTGVDVSFDVSLCILLSKQSRGRLIEISWCLFDITVMILYDICIDTGVIMPVGKPWPEEYWLRWKCFHSKETLSLAEELSFQHFPWWHHQMETFTPVNSSHKSQWRGALMCSLIWAWWDAITPIMMSL